MIKVIFKIEIRIGKEEYLLVENNSESYQRKFVIVRTTGLEPARTIVHQPLKLARLPIPPRAHF